MMHRAAVPVPQHGKYREAGGEILMNLRGAPDLMWAAFPQAQQPGGVVDLAVGENNAADMRSAQYAGFI